MGNYIQYRDHLKKEKEFILAVDETIININRVFSTSFDGSELGHSDYSGLAITKGMAKAIDDFENTDKLHEKDENHDIIVTHWKRIFRAIREFMRTVGMEVPNRLKSIEKAEKQTLIPIRDYQNYKPYAEVMTTLATIYDGSATYEDLASRHKDLLPNLEDDLTKMEKIWRGLFVKAPVSGKYIMNAFETKQIQTIAGSNMALAEAKDEVFDSIATELAMYHYTLIPMVKDPVAKEFLNLRWSEYMNKPLNEFKGLVSEQSLLRLNENNIFTGIDFLKAEYTFLRDKTKIKKEELTNLSLGLCSRLKYFVRGLSLRLVHPSCLDSKSANSIQDVAADLKQVFNVKEELTYGDILNKKEILLHHEKVNSFKNCYAVIAFIRYFDKRCSNGLPFRFTPLGRDWNFEEYLSIDEKRCLARKYDKILEINKETIKGSVTLNTKTSEKREEEPFLDTQSLDELEKSINSEEKGAVLSNNGGQEPLEESEENEEE